MRVRFVGSGDAFGSGGRWQTCIQLSRGGQVLLVDCGATTLAALKAQGLDPNAVGAVAVTHLHGDHFGGLPFLILDGQFSRRSEPLLVAGPPGTRARLTEAMETLFPGSSGARRRFAVEVRELTPDGSPAELGAATVRGWEVEHPCGAPPLALHLDDLCAKRVVLTHMSARMLGRLADADLPAAYDGMVMDLEGNEALPC